MRYVRQNLVFRPAFADQVMEEKTIDINAKVSYFVDIISRVFSKMTLACNLIFYYLIGIVNKTFSNVTNNMKVIQ